MELRHLRYFRVVAELQHFHKAANTLCISQPALSSQIKQLEEELNTKLFERVGRSVRLSESGELVLSSAKLILNQVELMRESVSDIESGDTGSLRIGVLQSISALYLRQLVIDFDRRYPNISLHIEELPNHQIESKVSLGEIDVGIGFILQREYKNVEFEVLFSEKWKLVVAPQHESMVADIMQGKSHKLKAILLPEYFETRKVVNRYFAANNVQVKQITEVNSITCILDLVESGHAFTVLPEAFSVLNARHSLRSFYLDPELPPRNIGFLIGKDRAQKSSVGKFRELFYEYLENR